MPVSFSASVIQCKCHSMSSVIQCQRHSSSISSRLWFFNYRLWFSNKPNLGIFNWKLQIFFKVFNLESLQFGIPYLTRKMVSESIVEVTIGFNTLDYPCSKTLGLLRAVWRYFSAELSDGQFEKWAEFWGMEAYLARKMASESIVEVTIGSSTLDYPCSKTPGLLRAVWRYFSAE